MGLSTLMAVKKFARAATTDTKIFTKMPKQLDQQQCKIEHSEIFMSWDHKCTITVLYGILNPMPRGGPVCHPGTMAGYDG